MDATSLAGDVAGNRTRSKANRKFQRLIDFFCKLPGRSSTISPLISYKMLG